MGPSSRKFLVIDDLALELPRYPIHVPVPPAAMRSDDTMKAFTLRVLGENEKP